MRSDSARTRPPRRASSTAGCAASSTSSAPESTIREAAGLVDRKGIVVVAGLFGGQVPFGFGAVPHEARFMTTVWGSIQDLAELIGLAQREGIRHTVERMPLTEAQAAHDRLRSGAAQGRIVLVP